MTQRKEMLKLRRERQRNRLGSATYSRGKYIPAGKNRNVPEGKK